MPFGAAAMTIAAKVGEGRKRSWLRYAYFSMKASMLSARMSGSAAA